LTSNTKGYGGKTHQSDSQNAIQLHLVAESGTICSSHLLNLHKMNAFWEVVLFLRNDSNKNFVCTMQYRYQ